MLAPLPARQRGKIDHDLVLGKAKLEEAESVEEAVGFLATSELRALLTDPGGYALLLDKQASGGPKAAITSAA
jgi:membrane glycosyltransferase